jgi:glycyl-tRNA synthetase alpha chain
MTLQELMTRLETFWLREGCIRVFPYDVEKGAGTMNPYTFFRALGPEPWKAAYFEPSRRPADGRYGDNPQRLEKHTQFQVLLKPSPQDAQALYLKSLEAIGMDLKKHDIRFEEDNWEAPTLGAWGVGWQVLADGCEITQFTYFQQVGGVDVRPISLELTYGVERLALFLSGNLESFYDLQWNEEFSFKGIRREAEVEFSRFNFELASAERHREMYRLAEEEAAALLDAGCALPAYDYVLKCSHYFNVLDARGAVGATERAHFIQRIRRLACRCAKVYMQARGWAEPEEGKEKRKKEAS